EDDRPIGSRLGDEALKAPGAADPIARKQADPLPDLGHDGSDGVVVVRLDAEHAGRLRCPEPGGMGQSERDLDLSKNVTGPPLADHALYAVDQLDRLDATVEQPEERWLVSFVNRELARGKADVGRDTTEALAIRRFEHCEHRDSLELVWRHHARDRSGPAA